MKKLFFIVIDGPMGSGKTTVGESLHPRLKRTAMVGVDRIKWFVSDFRRTKEDNAIARKALLAMCAAYLKNGISILLVQGFVNDEAMAPFLKLAKRARARLLLYRLHAPREVLLRRLSQRPKAALARKPVPKTRILRNLRLHAAHRYEGATLLDTSELDPGRVADRILKDLR